MLNFNLVEIEEEKIEQLKRFDLGIYPLHYPDVYYKQLAKNPLARIVLDGPDIIAAVTSRVELQGCRKVLYVQSLAVASLWREQGIGSRLLDFVEQAARDNSLDFITLHVQTNNLRAISLYQKRGYTIKETLATYYRRIQPSSAHLMEKSFL